MAVVAPLITQTDNKYVGMALTIQHHVMSSVTYHLIPK